MKSRAAVLSRVAEQPTAAPVPPAEWGSFTTGEKITIWRNGAHHPVTGTIDVATEDGSVFWIQLDHGLGRIAVHREDNVRVWRA